ncbi:MAG: biotin--[acetyl-CoA-carboxylase] ligase [Planctomycetaceae bacterium]|jgi:biotin-[acetyl-CoA-carboxylase] ligase BirA-like protein|nr:biotin--[acetyl-CoA-carboxylase] ligase [Planctomycetaceae bacterium]
MRFNNLDKIDLCELNPIRVYEYHDLISSTSDRVRELFQDFFVSDSGGGGRDGGGGGSCGDYFPCLVAAGEQTAGRGRNGKSWWSGEGGLMMSLGLELGAKYFPIRRELLPDFSPLVGGIIISILKNYLLSSNLVELRYPNDVYVNNKKIAGILIESPVPNFAIIGIGINVNNSIQNAPAEISQRLTTILDLTGKKTDLRKILQQFIAEFFNYCKAIPVS